MSATATRPLRYAGSEIAPTFRSSFDSVAAWKSCFSAMTVPEVPFGIRFFATSTGLGAVESFTLERYWTRYAISRIAASAAAPIPSTSVQPREFETLLVSEVLDTGEFLLGSVPIALIGGSSNERDPARRELIVDGRCIWINGDGLVFDRLDEHTGDCTLWRVGE